MPPTTHVGECENAIACNTVFIACGKAFACNTVFIACGNAFTICALMEILGANNRISLSLGIVCHVIQILNSGALHFPYSSIDENWEKVVNYFSIFIYRKKLC